MVYNIKICTEHYNVIGNGTVIIPEGEFCEFEIEGLKFRFNFSDKKEEGCQEKKSEIMGRLVKDEGSEYLSFDVVNFNGLFSTPQHMLEVGMLSGKKLYLRFSVAALVGNDNPSRIFHYTWFTEK